VESLNAATQGMADEERHWRDGLQTLDIHRHHNFEGNGTMKQLQILWWEFPPEHWDMLWDGSPMNFIMTLSGGITPNAPMMDEQVEIAAEFIDELWHIGIFELVLEDNEMLANAPLFTVPKPGQPGQWRVIADMKNGGQNDHIGKDPVHMPQAWGILERLDTAPSGKLSETKHLVFFI
jgi:hypothetical protein